MALRNFWIKAYIDGKYTPMASGPRSKDGGFDLTIQMRDRGGKFTPLRVYGIAGEDGHLTLGVEYSTPDEPEPGVEWNRAGRRIELTTRR